MNNNFLTEQEHINLLNEDPSHIYDIKNDEFTENIALFYANKYKKYNYKINKFLNNDEFIYKLLNISIHFFFDIELSLEKDRRIKFFKYIEPYYTVYTEARSTLAKQSPIVALNSVKKFPDSIIYFDKEAISDEVIEFFINSNLDLSRYKILLGNEKFLLKQIEKDPYIIEKIDISYVTPKAIDKAIENGYIPNLNSSLSNNSYYFKKLVEIDSDNLNYIKKDILNDDIIDAAVNNNYIYKFNGTREYITNISTYEKFGDDIEKWKNDNTFLLTNSKLVLSSYYNGYKSIFFEEEINISNNEDYKKLIDEFISSNIDIKYFRNSNLLKNDMVKNYIYKKYFNTPIKKELFEHYISVFPINDVILNFEKLTHVINENFIKIFGENMVYLIIKYLIVPNNKFDIEKFNDNQYENINKLFCIINQNNQNTLIILKFEKFINFFAENIFLFNSIIDNIELLDNNDINNLNFVIEVDQPIKIKNFNELKEFNKNYYNYLSSNNNISIKDKISLYLTGDRYLTFKKFLYTELNNSNINEIKEKYGFTIPEKYKIFIEYMEFIFSINDTESLNNIYKNMSYNEIEKISTEELTEVANKLFHNIYSSKLTCLNNLKPKRIENGVNVYELNGEDFSFLGHSIGAFDFGYVNSFGLNSLYKEEIGENYICLSYIDENHTTLFKKENNILFNQVSEEQLLSLSNVDTHTEKDEKTMEINVTNKKYLLPLEMSCKTIHYNEFVALRQDNNCNPILPCAILCYDDKNLPYKAAKAYGLSIVIINEKAYEEKRILKYNNYKNDVLNGDLTHLEELIALSFKLNRLLTEEELKIINEYIYNYEDNYLLFLLKRYKYDDELIERLANKSKKL